MAKPSDTEKQTLTWGTWEELLLACAVNRYGTDSWDSVAIELQKRSSSLHLLTAQSCKQKFHDLKRRFTVQTDDVIENDGDCDDDDKTTTNTTTYTVPWLDELKKLRVAELKREVERYDLSIVSLQLKVKRLTEEREQSFKESEEERENSDLEKTVEEVKEEVKKDGDGEPEKSPPESVADEQVPGEISEHDNQSMNQSNSTDPKVEDLETKQDDADEKREPVEAVNGESDPVGESGKPAGEGSYNGSSDTVAKESANSLVENSEKTDPVRESGESPESVAESKDGGVGEEGTKANSDEHSSVKSPPENEDQSPAIKCNSVNSQPLLDFLDIIRSHKHGSVFERRLTSQDTTKYKSLVRQHIDLETIRTRIQEGCYSECIPKFFRDLLLLFNNALVFYVKESSESMAAIELRQLVSKEMTSRAPKSESARKEQVPVPPVVHLSVKSDPEPSGSLLAKQKVSGPMIACRKRSSIAAKTSATSSERKKEQTAAASLVDEKPVSNWKQQDIQSVDEDDQENGITKKRTRERFTTSAKNSSKNNKNRTNTNTNKNLEPNSKENLESKVDKKNNNNTVSSASASAKRQGAANFLNRMKRSSSSSNKGSVVETTKNNTENNKGGGAGGGGAENKKNVGNNNRSDVKKEQPQPPRRGGSSGRQAKEQQQESPTKRNVGRPPKRAAAPAPLVLPGKRSREVADTETVGSSRQAKKRARR